MKVHQTSLSEADLFGEALPLKDLSQGEAHDFGNIIQHLIQPILSLCERMGDAHISKRSRKKELDLKWEREIFHINCLNCILVSFSKT